MTDSAFDHEYLDISEAGDVVIGWAPALEQFEGVAERLPAALTEAGYVFDPECTWGFDTTCRLRWDDRVATLLARTPTGADYEWVELHLRPAGLKPRERLPGRCVAPPQRSRASVVDSGGIDQNGDSRRRIDDDPLQTRPTFDLDGDGVADVLVPLARGGPCPWQVPHDVYVMRGDCGHRVGTIVGEVVHDTKVARFDHGLRVVTTEAVWSALERGAAPIRHERTRQYAFDGRKLRKRTDEERTIECHHCGIERCE